MLKDAASAHGRKWHKADIAQHSLGCPLSQAKQTFRGNPAMSASDAVDGAHSAASMCHRVVASKRTTRGEPSMGEVSTIGLDIAKSIFQVHGVDADGAVVIRTRVSRNKVLQFFADLPPCLVGIEACPTAHHWSRELRSLGHTVKLMPPNYVKAYLKRAKNDANDAAAICEAVTRPSMRFVATKSKQQQAALMLHRTRQLLVRQRTMLSNAIRGQLAEFGIVASTGRLGFKRLLEMMDGPEELGIPKVAWVSLMALAEQHQRLQAEIGKLEQCIQAWHRPAVDWRRSRALAQSWQRRWSARSPTHMPLHQVAIWRPGSAWCRSRTRPAARSVSGA